MEIPDVQGLDKLYQAISEALEIEKCSICLERLESTVLLWPCTHWFCNKCILTLHKSAKGEKVTCPLCKSVTTRRKVLPFQDQQTEYEDHLQTLIGALSLDLKFDVTSYNNVRRHESTTDKMIKETDKELCPLSLFKKTRTKALVRVIEVQKSSDVQQNKKRPTRRSGNLHPTNMNSFTVKNNKAQSVKTPKPIPALLPETPDSPKRKKVKEWLDSNKFSQADQDACVETVVADVHSADQDEYFCFSESALQSVSQIDHRSKETPIKPTPRKKPIVTPSDIDAIKVCKMPSENLFSTKGKFAKNQKAITMPAIEKFDELFPENRKLQAVTTTYGSKNPYTSIRTRGQRFAVQVDVFNNIDSNKGDIDGKSSPGEAIGNSEETLEDFSSGSGEEWTIEKVPRKCSLLNKDKHLNNTKQSAKQKRKTSIEKYVSAKPMESGLRNSIKKDLQSQKTRRNYQPNPNNYKEDKNKTPVKCVVEEFIKPKDYIVKEIIDDWNDTKDSNNLFLVKSQTSTKHNGNAISEVKCGENSKTKSENIISEFNRPNVPANIENDVAKTPSKEVNTRSPGWSRLKSTKKEFHLSDKKKLSLKTFNKSKSNSSLTNIGISPLLNHSKSTVSSVSKTNLEQSMVQSDSSISMDKMVNSSKSDVDDKCKELNVAIPCDTKPQKTPELGKNLNTSLTSSASGSPFRGFPTPEEKECPKKCVSNLNHIKEIPQKPCNTFCFPQKKSEKSSKVANENLVHLSGSLSKEDPMEVDIQPSEDPEIKLQCENKINENLTIASKMKTLGTSNFLETSNVTTISQEEPHRCPVSTKKRDRDSGIHNESGISSPIRKRVCRDAEVQTSPGRMESAIRDMLKHMCGIDLEEMIKQSNKADLPRNLNTVDVTSPNHSFTGISQDSDKENVDIVSKSQNASKKCSDDSDIVFGTEDSIALAQINHIVLRGEKIFENNYIDPDAPTQPNKTPVVRKRPLQTSTKEYTVVSNPTSSELKRTDSLFDKSDVVFPDETPKGATPWNYSGVNQLEGNTGTVKKSVDENAILQSSQCLKEKTNRSRRQLDFVGESSNDIFEFERQSSDKLRKEVVNNESNNCDHSDKVKTSHDTIEELDDIFMEGNEPLDGVLNSPDKDESTSHKNILTIKHPELNVENEIEGENLSDTPGIVGPSEVQCFYSRVNLCSPIKQSDQADSDKNISDKPVMCSPNTRVKTGGTENKNSHFQQLSNEVVKTRSGVHQGSPFIDKESSTEQKATSTNYLNAREDDEASNPSSDISYVEGTPDISQNEENRNEILNIEKDINETGGQSLKIVDTSGEVHSKREIAESEISLYDPSQKNKSLYILEESQQTDKEKIIDRNESVSMIENTEVEDEHLCFASSLLNPQQNQVLACVLGGMGLTYSKTVGAHISHLIVGTKNGCFQNTYKVLLAMALHKPIIRFDWVEEVIRTGGTIPLDPFVALDPSGECGVIRAKADVNRKLLRNFAIHIYNVNDRIVLKEQIEELARLCGGTVVKELSDFCEIPRDKYRIIVLSEPPDSLTQGDWRRKYSAVEVMIDWVYNTIGRYRVMPLVPFMVAEAADAVPFLQLQGYPKELVFDLSTQE